MSVAAELFAIISGDVQGCGFRYQIKKLADEKQITGYALNLPNKSVEIVAQGPRHILEEFIDEVEFLKKPVEINDVKVAWVTPKKSWAEFQVR